MNQKKLDRARKFQQQQQESFTPPENRHEENFDDAQYDEAQYHDVTTYLEWQAPARPFKHRSKEFFINALLITVAIEIICFLFSQYFLMAVIASLVFLAFALASVPPKTYTYRISSEGILVENEFLIWDELYDFFFLKTHGVEVMYVRTKSFYPGLLTLPMGDISEAQFKSVLLHYIPFREHVEPSFMEKAGSWLEKNFPLERSAR
jgi:hypothetical protein